MRLVSVIFNGQNRTAIVENPKQLRLVHGGSAYELFMAAIKNNENFCDFFMSRASDEILDFAQTAVLKNFLPPVMPLDPKKCMISGTGLTHLGSAKTRDEMHQELANNQNKTDSMKMFECGLSHGRAQNPAEPEWFYKGDGRALVAPYHEFLVPDFVKDAGEEPELAGIFLIDPEGEPVLLGYALGNELSDHVKERENYLLLAASKLMPCSIGPELFLGELPQKISGRSEIWRDGEIIFSREFFTGNAVMTHDFSALAHHHFKHPAHRNPLDLHVHFFGTAVLSFADGVRTRDGDVFRIYGDIFSAPLVNTLKKSIRKDEK